jgi:hypothetical protein
LRQSWLFPHTCWRLAMSDEVEKIEQVDLSKITIAEVLNMKNTAMRDAILEAMQVRRPMHTAYNKFSSHVMAV